MKLIWNAPDFVVSYLRAAFVDHLLTVRLTHVDGLRPAVDASRSGRAHEDVVGRSEDVLIGLSSLAGTGRVYIWMSYRRLVRLQAASCSTASTIRPRPSSCTRPNPVVSSSVARDAPSAPAPVLLHRLPSRSHRMMKGGEIWRATGGLRLRLRPVMLGFDRP